MMMWGEDDDAVAVPPWKGISHIQIFDIVYICVYIVHNRFLFVGRKRGLRTHFPFTCVGVQSTIIIDWTRHMWLGSCCNDPSIKCSPFLLWHIWSRKKVFVSSGGRTLISMTLWSQVSDYLAISRKMAYVYVKCHFLHIMKIHKCESTFVFEEICSQHHTIWR